MRKIPDFLKPENIKKPSSKSILMMESIKKYEEKFNDGPITEPSHLTESEWIEALDYCVEHDITIWEYLGEEYNPESDY